MILGIVFDQVVKIAIAKNIRLSEQKPVIRGILSLTHLQNNGAAWSILQNQQWFFKIVTIVVMIGLVWYYIRQIKGSLWTLFSLYLMMAGALGNFIDRVRLGYVVDMFHLDFINFPIFNVADMCLSVGVGLLFICILKEEYDGNKG